MINKFIYDNIFKFPKLIYTVGLFFEHLLIIITSTLLCVFVMVVTTHVYTSGSGWIQIIVSSHSCQLPR